MGNVLAVLIPGVAGVVSYALFTTLFRLDEAREIARIVLRR
jgi:hypothetical protein